MEDGWLRDTVLLWRGAVVALVVIAAALAFTGHGYASFGVATTVFAIGLSGRASALELLPVGMALAFGLHASIYIVAEWFDVNLFGATAARTVFAMIALAGGALSWLRAGKGFALVRWDDLAYLVFPIGFVVMLGGLAWVFEFPTLVSWFVEGGDHMSHLNFLAGLREAGHSLYFEETFANGYPHATHLMVGSMLGVDGSSWTVGNLVGRMGMFEAIVFGQFVWASTMVTRRLAIRLNLGQWPALAGTAVVTVLLLGRPFVTFTLASGFLTTIVSAWLLAVAMQVVSVWAPQPKKAFLLLLSVAIGISGSWQLLLAPLGVLMLILLVQARPLWSKDMLLPAVAAVAAIPFVAMPFYSAISANAGSAIDAVGASHPEPVMHLLLGGAALVAITVLARRVSARDKWLLLAMPVVLGVAAVGLTLLIGLEPDGQAPYYPKKLAFHAMCLLVPLGGVWIAMLVQSARGLIWGGASSVALLVIVCAVVMGDYLGYLGAYRELAEGRPGLGVDLAERFLRASDRAEKLLDDGGGAVVVIGSGSPYHDRELAGAIGFSQQYPAPFDFALYDPPTLDERCEYASAYSRIIVVDLRDTPSLEGCLATLPGTVLVGAS